MESLQELRALGYSDWDDLEEPDHPGSGVTFIEPASVSSARRIWTDDTNSILSLDPGGDGLRRLTVPGHRQVEMARPLEGGRMIALSVDEGLTLLNDAGQVLWQVALDCHHEVTVAPRPGDLPGGRLLAVAVHHERPFQGRRVRFDEVVFIEESTGALTSDVAWAPWSTWEHRETLDAQVGGQPHALSLPPKSPASQETVYDYFHLNGIAFDGPDTMHVCLRNVSLVAEVDLPGGEVIGGVGPGLLDWPHAPSVFHAANEGEQSGSADRLLIFDNGAHRGWSRVLEIDLGTQEVCWSWKGEPDRPLWSRVRGYVERLPGGNVLITESERGCALEVTRAGRIVWEFQNPDVIKSDSRAQRRRIYRMHADVSGE